MPEISFPAVLVAAPVVFLIGWTYYALLPAQWAEQSQTGAAAEQPAPWKLAVELGRGLILATVVAGLAAQGEIDRWSGSLLLGLVLWIGFPFVLWTGAIIWENTPWRLAALHAGDWLVKLLVVAVLVSVWQ